eukprot:GEMP01050305.1.p1 GENE.GEMP01050305.1~~GEMP01050305.1.p1  ORF type:complete len:390 (+),score=98.95 GEMP01050305.1:155-1324(+)
MYRALLVCLLVATPVVSVRSKAHIESHRRFLKTCNPKKPDWKDIECVKGEYPAFYERRRPVALLSVGCTAWRVGPKNHMMTNNHCYNGDRAAVTRSSITFDHQHVSCGGRSTAKTVKVQAGKLLLNSNALDYTLFTVRTSDMGKIKQFGYFGLDLRVPTPGELVYVIHHTVKYATSNHKWVTTNYDHEANNPRCKWARVVPEGRGGRRGESFCDISAGGSGSPVIAVASNKIISLNFGGYDQNDNSPEACGVKSHLAVDIWKEIKNEFGGQVPEGDAPGTTTKTPPSSTKAPGTTPSSTKAPDATTSSTKAPDATATEAQDAFPPSSIILLVVCCFFVLVGLAFLYRGRTQEEEPSSFQNPPTRQKKPGSRARNKHGKKKPRTKEEGKE